jgi:hypothetical protein
MLRAFEIDRNKESRWLGRRKLILLLSLWTRRLDNGEPTLYSYVKYERKLQQLSDRRFATNTQGVPGEKVNVLGGHSSSHFKQKLYMYMCPIPNGFRDRVISLYSSKIVDKKEILRTVSNAGIYCSSDKVGTVYLI